MLTTVASTSVHVEVNNKQYFRDPRLNQGRDLAAGAAGRHVFIEAVRGREAT